MGVFSIKNRYTGELINPGREGSTQKYIDYIHKLQSHVSRLEKELNIDADKVQNKQVDELKQQLEQERALNAEYRKDIEAFEITKNTEIQGIIDLKNEEIEELEKQLTNKDVIISKLKAETLECRIITDPEVEELLQKKNLEIDKLKKQYARACSGGHKTSCTEREIEEIRQRRVDGETLQTLADKYKVSIRTIRRYTNDLEVDARKKEKR